MLFLLLIVLFIKKRKHQVQSKVSHNHLLILTTCPQRPIFQGPVLHMYFQCVRVPPNNDHLSTTVTIWSPEDNRCTLIWLYNKKLIEKNFYLLECSERIFCHTRVVSEIHSCCVTNQVFMINTPKSQTHFQIRIVVKFCLLNYLAFWYIFHK